jgi:metallophosphoesterase superfamily enzyme
MELKSKATAEPGDVVVVHGHSTGQPERTGVILEVVGAAGHEHYRVRWDEEHESLFWLGSDATIRPGTRRRRGSKA